MGFKPIAYRGPETGSRSITSYVVSNGNATFVLTAPIRAPEHDGNHQQDISEEERVLLKEIHSHLTKHGDGIKDVAFLVDGDVGAVWRKAVDRGAVPVKSPRAVKVGHDGRSQIVLATIGAYGDTVHSLVNREKFYSGPFLPGYEVAVEDDPINAVLPKVDFIEIDHCVGNQPWNWVDRVVK